MKPARQLQLDGFVFPAPPRHRRWRQKPRWEQLQLLVAGMPLLKWQPTLAPVIPLRPRRLKAAEDPTLPRREVDWKPPAEQKILFDEWERRLAKEGMPAELSGDGLARISDEQLDYLAQPGGGVRPTLSRRDRDSEGNRAEHGTSRGAWWHAEVEPDIDGAERWCQMADEVRRFVDGAIEEALSGEPDAILTAPQASVLRHWFEGLAQTDIARLEGHSKVTVHHKLHRALARVTEALRAAGMGQG